MTSTATFRVRDSGSPQETATKPLINHDHSTNAAAYYNHFAPPGTINVAYSQTILANGGTGTRTWIVTGGQLPSGLNLNASNGNISGTPTSPGPFSFTVQVIDQAQLSDEQNLTITIDLPAPPTITTTTLPNGNVIKPYSQQLQATGGSGNLTWATIAGSLPPGLGMDAAGLISGIPIVAGPSTFTVQATDELNDLTHKISRSQSIFKYHRESSSTRLTGNIRYIPRKQWTTCSQRPSCKKTPLDQSSRHGSPNRLLFPPTDKGPVYEHPREDTDRANR